MSFVVNDEDFCCDGFINWECECALISGFFLAVRDLLICTVCNEFKDLQVVFPFDFHAVNTVLEDYLSDERYGVCYASCDITLIVEHNFSFPGHKKSSKQLRFGEISVCRYKRIAHI